MKYPIIILTMIFIISPVFAATYIETLNITKEQIELMKIIEKELIDESSQVRKEAYKKATEDLSRVSLFYFISILKDEEHPELRYVAKLLKKQFFKPVIKPQLYNESLINKDELYEKAKNLKR